jgi:hypothetical protein
MIDIQGSEPTLGQLAKQSLLDSEKWFDDLENDCIYSIPYTVLALCGEAGELANIIKKIERGSLSWKDSGTKYDAVMESIDIFVYLLNFWALANVDPYKLHQTKRAINDKRFMAERAVREARREAANDNPFE